MSLAAGVDLFNQRRFWDAHEAWEERWLVAHGEEKLFLQGLIQLAAAFHHIQREGGSLSGATRLIDAALAKLEPFPHDFGGVDRGAAVTSARLHREALARGERLADFPRLDLAGQS